MYLLPLKHLVAASLLLSAATASNRMYDRATMTNYAHFPAVVTINYASCKKDVFTVAAAPNGVSWRPTVATAPTRRGACLITSITATLQGDTSRVTAYSSTGTSYSQFYVREPFCGSGGWRIWSKAEYGTNSSGCFGGRHR